MRQCSSLLVLGKRSAVKPRQNGGSHFGTRQRLAGFDSNSDIVIAGSKVSFNDSLKLLGAGMDTGRVDPRVRSGRVGSKYLKCIIFFSVSRVE